ncbi:MAG: hypothetical protein COV71_01470 [Candidatus Omnitrophica bacterium CG11_big_fil_rev_8_21_14_0_20_41_12]|nr:MAG: hypothetical protein COV71_01470 [Candidatus Omnitrophica bacterium CG11_big_fil_rev_8_21_14_0_20_41_12]
MENKDKPKWYFKDWSLIISFLCVGPFMLPLVWTNPRFSKQAKITVSIVIVILTYFLILMLASSLKSITNYYQLMQQQI